MKSSENINELATALNKAQSEMMGAAMDAENPFFKSKYADLKSVWKAAKGPLTNNGLSIVQGPIPTESGIRLATRLMHISGQWIESELTMPTTKEDPQQYGSAITYARRYSLSAMIGIYQDDDDAEYLRKIEEKKKKDPERERLAQEQQDNFAEQKGQIPSDISAMEKELSEYKEVKMLSEFEIDSFRDQLENKAWEEARDTYNQIISRIKTDENIS